MYNPAASSISVTLNAQITSARNDGVENLFIGFSEKIRPDISCESSAGQRIRMKTSSLIFVER